ncbi:MAG: methyltransferase domain-containing protein [Rhizobiales bacterium]|nr:methyltransferase domain-containing protein [Hyphomicrobiales bacterium]
MRLLQSFARPLAAAGVVVVISLSCAQAQPAQRAQPSNAYEPQVGQQGKDVIWVPTNQRLVYKMMELAGVTSDDYVIDLGSGDGRTVITAAKRGARAHGIEYNPDMVELSKRNAAKEGVGGQATFVRGDIFESDFSKANVITLFLLPQLNVRLRPTILDMKPGTRVASNTFDMGDWTPDKTITLDECTSHCTANYWIVPAKVEGTWRLPQGDLTLKQEYQVISGTLKSENGNVPVTGRLTGDQISFKAGNMEFTGRVSGNTIEGSSRPAGSETQWQATRGG